MSQIVDVIKILTERLKIKPVHHLESMVKHIQVALLLNYYDKLEEVVFYKAKNELDRSTSVNHVKLDGEDFNDLVKMGVLQVTSRMEDFVYGAVKEKELERLNQIIINIKTELLNENWKVELINTKGSLSPGDKEDQLIIRIYAFDLNVNFDDKDNIIINTPPYILGYPTYDEHNTYVSQLFNFLFERNKEEFKTKLINEIKLYNLSDTLLESMLDGRNLNKRFLFN